MTTSGNYSYTQNRDQIIKRAARLINAISSGETPGSDLVQDFSDALNAMVKAWMATGIHVWTQSEATLIVQPNQITYNLGPNATDNCYDTTQGIQTTTTAYSALGGTVIPVASVANMAVGYYVGLVLDSGYVFWTTISAINTGALTVTLTNNLTDSVASGNDMYAYPVRIQRPLRILSARRYVWIGQVSTPMNPALSRSDYRDLPLVNNTGPCTQFFYDPQIPQGILSIWPSPPDVSAAIRFTYMRPLQDFTTAADTGDFPVEWINTMVYGLAYTMAPEFAVPTEQYNMIKEQFQMWFDLTSAFDKEPESIYLGVNHNQR